MSNTVGDCSTCGLPRLPDGTCPACKHNVLHQSPDQYPAQEPDAVTEWPQSNLKQELGHGLVILGGYTTFITLCVWLAATEESLLWLTIKILLWAGFIHLLMGVLMVFVALVTMQPGDRE